MKYKTCDCNWFMLEFGCPKCNPSRWISDWQENEYKKEKQKKELTQANESGKFTQSKQTQEI